MQTAEIYVCIGAHTPAPSSGRILKSLKEWVYKFYGHGVVNISLHFPDYYQQNLSDKGLNLSWIIFSTHIELVFIAAEFTEVLDSIAWVRCASGNVLNKKEDVKTFYG